MKTNNTNRFIKEEILNKATLFNGNNMDSLKSLSDNSVDSVVTDPPYGLSFMGKKWDHDVPSVEFWKEVFRVLKPGGHVLSFGGTRTYHRMVVNIEDAGFEIRDQIMWIYGQGFPKSHDIGKAVDKIQGNERKVTGSKGSQITGGGQLNGNNTRKEVFVTEGSSEFEGWGTALKPANEPICVARKPISEKSVALNAIKYGTGGLNIDGSKVGTDKVSTHTNGNGHLGKNGIYNDFKPQTGSELREGRFPSNVIMDQAMGEELGDQRKFFYCPKVSNPERNLGLDFMESQRIEGRDAGQDSRNVPFKIGTNERKNIHPTVKPVDLMRYLIKLVTPKNGVILDPFMGSGSTGVGALIEGFQFIGMEMDNGYFEIAKQRIQHFEKFKEMLDKKKMAKTPSKSKKQPKKKVETTVQSDKIPLYGIWANRGLRRIA